MVGAAITKQRYVYINKYAIKESHCEKWKLNFHEFHFYLFEIKDEKKNIKLEGQLCFIL